MDLSPFSVNPIYIAPSAWWQHVPIAHWLTFALRPERVVELGSHYGVSFFAFCEAAEAFSPHTFVYAVDTWGGDEHAGYYDEDVYNKVLRHWEDHHRVRSRLVRSTFDLAAEHFEDKSIDILHIDGLHTYDAVKHDYETWLPKLKDEAIVLFHDINVREREFGVWKLWQAIKDDNSTHEVLNGHGLGILVFGENMHKKLAELPASLSTLQAKGEILEKLAQLSLDLASGLAAADQARAEADQARAEADQARAEADQARAEADQARAEVKQVAHNLRSMQESRIWKLTRPVRLIADCGKSLLRGKE
jgi:hypothetical protein